MVQKPKVNWLKTRRAQVEKCVIPGANKKIFGIAKVLTKIEKDCLPLEIY